MGGWVKLHRQMLSNIDLMVDNTAFVVFVVLLLKANPKGQVLTSSRQIGAELEIPHMTVYGALERLNKYQMTVQSTVHKKTLITICNWSKYQSNAVQSTVHRPYTSRTPAVHTTGAVRIENKNKESGKPVFGPGYRKAKEIATQIKANKKL